MNKAHASFFSACYEASKGSKMSYRLGAVVVKNSRIIGKGRNSVIRPPPFTDALFPPEKGRAFLTTSLHAEAAAIRSCLPHTHRPSLSNLPPYSLPPSTLLDTSPLTSSRPLSTYSSHFSKRTPKHPRHHASSTPPLQGTSLYVGRYNNLDRAMTAKPCWRCLQMMKEVGVKKVFWTQGPEVEDGKLFGEAKVEDMWEEFMEEEGNLVDSEWLTMVERGLVQRVRRSATRLDPCFFGRTKELAHLATSIISRPALLVTSTHPPTIPPCIAPYFYTSSQLHLHHHSPLT